MTRLPPKPLFTLAAASLLTLSSTGCLVVGYTSRGGWFLWPGSISFLIMLLLLALALRRR